MFELLNEIQKMNKGDMNIKILFPMLNQIPEERLLVPICLNELKDTKSWKRIIIDEGN